MRIPQAPLPVYFPDEALLIKAEALANQESARAVAGRARLACAPIAPAAAGSTIRRRACRRSPVQLTQAELLAEIYLQRRYELFGTGLRWEDARRRNAIRGPTAAPGDPDGRPALLAAVRRRRPQREPERDVRGTSRSDGAVDLPCELPTVRPLMTFPMAHRRLTFTAVAALIAAACGTKDVADPLEPTGPQGRIRFVNLITDPARNPVNAILEGVPFGVNLAYTATTPAALPAPSTANFSAILEGSRTLVLRKTADPSVVVGTLPINVGAGTDYTLYATGGTAGATVIGFTVGDNNLPITTGQARIKFVNMSPTAGAVDVFITAANADLATATPVATNVATRGVFGGALFAPGTYQVRTVPAGTAAAARAAAVNSTLSGVVVVAGNGRTVVVADAAAGGAPLSSLR